MEGATPNCSSKRPCIQYQDDVRKSQPRRLQCGDSPVETPSPHMVESPGIGVNKPKNTRRRRGGECSKAAPHYQPYGRQRTRQKLRQLIPAGPEPNSSVYENQRQEFERQMRLSNPLRRTTGLADDNFAYLPQTPFPCSAGQQSSNHHATNTLPMNPGGIHLSQQHGVFYGNMPAESGGSSLSQTRAVAGFNSAAAYPPYSFSQPQATYMAFPDFLEIPPQYPTRANLQPSYPPPMSHNAGPAETQPWQQNAQSNAHPNLFDWNPVGYVNHSDPVAIEQTRGMYLVEGPVKNGNGVVDGFDIP